MSQPCLGGTLTRSPSFAGWLQTNLATFLAYVSTGTVTVSCLDALIPIGPGPRPPADRWRTWLPDLRAR